MSARTTAFSIAAAITLSMGVAAPAVAAVTFTNVAGGNWEHGTANGTVRSNFYHYTRYHSSSVKQSTGRIFRSGCTRPRATSYASAVDTWRVDYSYYNFC